ncbi:hypothetical protein D3C84_1295580 [compost metagenome]
MAALSRGLTRELSSMARAMGMGKKNTSWNAVITRVFLTACQKSGSASTRAKLSTPTQGLAGMPTYGE